jgi:hypothetical protein
VEAATQSIDIFPLFLQFAVGSEIVNMVPIFLFLVFVSSSGALTNEEITRQFKEHYFNLTRIRTAPVIHFSNKPNTQQTSTGAPFDFSLEEDHHNSSFDGQELIVSQTILMHFLCVCMSEMLP